MATNTPKTPGTGSAKKPAARKTTTPKPAAKSAQTKANKADAPVTTAGEPQVIATPDPEPATTEATADAPTGATTGPAAATPVEPVAPVAPTPVEPAQSPTGRGNGSVLDSVRTNPVGPLMVGLIVAIAIGLLMSVLVPEDPGALPMTILGLLVAAAVGFSMRYLSVGGGLRHQIEAFIVTGVGVHLMSITGMVGGDIPLLSEFGISGPGFNEALLAALATPAVSTGGLLAGLVAVIIVGWRSRAVSTHDSRVY